MTRPTVALAAFVVVTAAALPKAAAQQVFGLAGLMQADSPDQSSYAWLLSYQQELGEHWAASFAWQNEGHVTHHHRDGHSVQVWAKTKLFNPRFEMAAGIGPYRYYDTTVSTSGDSHEDDHGYGILFSVTATWEGRGHWLYRAQVNRVQTNSSIDTTEVLLGVGYKLQPDTVSIHPDVADKRDEVTVFVGRTIVNSFESEKGVATSIEYRRAFGPVGKLSIAWINEGDPRVIRRNGIVGQVWLEPSFSQDRFTFGLGLGLYVAVDQYREGDHGAFGAGICTMTTSYHIGQNWTARFSWNRILSDYDRDTDIFLLGLGYRL